VPDIPLELTVLNENIANHTRKTTNRQGWRRSGFKDQVARLPMKLVIQLASELVARL